MNQVKKIVEDLNLAEGPIWDQTRNCIHFIDIDGCAVYSYYLKNEKIAKISLGDKVGFIMLNQENQLIAGVRNQLIQFDLDNNTQKVICEIDQPSTLLLNDGKCDVHGNLWVGAMAEDLSQPGAFDQGVLYCISNNQLVKTYTGFSIPNGMDWNESGDQFYHVDSFTNTITTYEIHDQTTLVKCDELIIDEALGGPDGMCVDQDGNLWVAMWNGGKVCCYDINTKEILHTIDMGSQVVTCVNFGGEDLSDLYITTSVNEINGCLYVTHIDGICGKLGHHYNG